MSMISAQCDELRSMAASVGLEVPQAATLMMEAADTIWELRSDVLRERGHVLDAEHEESVAWDRVHKAEAENAKLREDNDRLIQAIEDLHNVSLEDELVRLENENAKLRELCRCFAEYVSQDRCEGCVYKSRCNDGLVDECWQRTEIRKMARELGVEADG